MLLATLLAVVTPLQSTPPELFVTGKPIPGHSITFEIESTNPAQHFLLLEGPTHRLAQFTLAAFQPPRKLIALTLSPCGKGSFELPLSPSAQLDGAMLRAQVMTRGSSPPSPVLTIEITSALPLEAVNDFTYQLQGSPGADLSLATIASSAFDLCIVDFSRDGLSEFSPAEVAALKSQAEPERIRLAYMSIGEAEDYRWYWNLISPSLIAASNPNWPGNFKVQYWEPEWKEVIITGNAAVGKSFLDRIIDQGFDGVYLDVVDAFEFFGPLEAGGNDWRRNAASEMAEFMLEIAHHARVVRGKPNFLIVPQNGSTIIEQEWYPQDTLLPCDPPTPPAMADLTKNRLLSTVDAIGVEDVFYGGNADVDNPYAPDNYRLGILQEWTNAGAIVLATDYLTQRTAIDAFYTTHAPAEGFVPYATVRDLDNLTINPGHAPD